MRTVLIGAMSEKNYESIKRELYLKIAAHVVSCHYDYEDYKAFFSFVDTDCIPECMKPYIIDAFPKQDLSFLDQEIKPYMHHVPGERIINPPRKLKEE